MTKAEPDTLLPRLAEAMVDNPRASLLDLAKAVGVSKATLYRYSHTREDLIARLSEHSMAVLWEVTEPAKSDSMHPLEALRTMTRHHMEHRELSSFLLYFWRDKAMHMKASADWHERMDAFFLHGQKAGVFRIDIPAPALTKIWSFTLIGLVNGERDGRIARASLATIAEQVLLDGIVTRKS